MQYIHETFSSIAEFIAKVGDRKTVSGMYESSLEISSYRDEFTGTHTYDEATQLALYGDRDSMNKVQVCTTKMKAESKTNEQRTQNRVVRCVAGSRPCVPAAILGQPNSMYRRMNNKVNKPVVNVFYNMAASCSVDADEIVRAGAKLAQAIQIVERSGVRVNLFAGSAGTTHGQVGTMYIKIKDSAKDFDLLRMSYILINPSFLRRHYFRWVETKPELNARHWGAGHGRPLDENELKNLQAEMKQKNIKYDCFISNEELRGGRAGAEDIAKKILGK